LGVLAPIGRECLLRPLNLDVKNNQNISPQADKKDKRDKKDKKDKKR